MNYKKSYQIYLIGLFAAFALIATSLLLQIDWLGIVGVVLFVFDLLQTGIFYRCPNCGKQRKYGEKSTFTPRQQTHPVRQLRRFHDLGNGTPQALLFSAHPLYRSDAYARWGRNAGSRY